MEKYTKEPAPNVEREKHPELREGEVFLTNVPAVYYDAKGAFNSGTFTVRDVDLPVRLLRLGEHAYDSSGNKMRKARPVFVKREDIEFFGFTCVSAHRVF
jgi:hypothetical protein